MEASNDTEDWHQKLVIDKSQCLSDLLVAKRPGMMSDFPQDREQATEDIVEVMKTLPSDFLQKEDVKLLLEYFLNSLETSALTGGAVIRGVHHLVLNTKNRPDNFEMVLYRVLFKEGNLQSWSQKERQTQYEILNWLLRNRMSLLKGLGNEFLTTFIKSVSGERDPRCLVQMFSAFLEVAKSFSFGPFTEDMFETIACYFPVEFKPQPKDTISREYLAASCASCLVSSPSFAPFCFLFIDEKLNDEDDVSDEEIHDVLDLLVLACKSFPANANKLSNLEPILDGIRKIGLNPKNKVDMPEYVWRSFEEVLRVCVGCSDGNSIGRVVTSLLENSEPFVLQAEMGLCKKALTLLRCAFRSLPAQHSEVIYNQTIAWILNLVQGDSVNAAANKSEIVEEGLGYLVEWVRLGGERKESSVKTLTVFEQSLFDSCSLAKEIRPKEAVMSSYECALAYFQLGIGSDELVGKCRSLVALALRTPLEKDEFGSLLKLISVFSLAHFDQIKVVLADNSIDTWNQEKVLPILCAMSSTRLGWDFLKNKIGIQLENAFKTVEHRLNCYVDMMSKASEDRELFSQQFETLDSVLFKLGAFSQSAAQTLQSVSILLNAEEHKKFMDQITARYKSDEKFGGNYHLTFLQNLKSEDLIFVAENRKNISDRSTRQLYFAACNRSPGQFPVPEHYRIAEIKSNLLRNTRDSLEAFERFLATGPHDFEYLFDFESADSAPELSRFETGSPLWRQRMFCQIVPIFARNFKETLVEMLPHLLKFAMPLDSNQLKRQFALLLPVLIKSISLDGPIPTHVTSSVPMFLTIAEPLQPDELKTIIGFLCKTVKNTELTMASLEDALNSLNTLARRQPPKSLHSEVSLVVVSINKMLGHKKRLLRVLAADVKNNWEMLITK